MSAVARAKSRSRTWELNSGAVADVNDCNGPLERPKEQMCRKLSETAGLDTPEPCFLWWTPAQVAERVPALFIGAVT
jgi:hypothetical protein